MSVLITKNKFFMPPRSSNKGPYEEELQGVDVLERFKSEVPDLLRKMREGKEMHAICSRIKSTIAPERVWQTSRNNAYERLGATMFRQARKSLIDISIALFREVGEEEATAAFTENVLTELDSSLLHQFIIDVLKLRASILYEL